MREEERKRGREQTAMLKKCDQSKVTERKKGKG